MTIETEHINTSETMVLLFQQGVSNILIWICKLIILNCWKGGLKFIKVYVIQHTHILATQMHANDVIYTCVIYSFIAVFLFGWMFMYSSI